MDVTLNTSYNLIHLYNAFCLNIFLLLFDFGVWFFLLLLLFAYFFSTERGMVNSSYTLGGKKNPQNSKHSNGNFVGFFSLPVKNH